MPYNDTYLIQTGLKALGFDPGPIDGLPGAKTNAARASWLTSTKPAALPAPTVSDRALSLIKHFESCLEPTGDGRFKSYADPGYGWEVPTIGWGTIQYPDGRKVKRGDIITQSQADEYFAFEVSEKAAGVAKLITVLLNPDRFGAVVSFAYNVGLGNLKTSTLLKRINASDFAGAADEFLKWNKSNHQVLPGLTRRRKSERNLFIGLDNFIVEA